MHGLPQVRSLRGNDPTQRMPPRKPDAAMIDLWLTASGLQSLRNLAFQNRSSTRGAPVALRLLTHHRVTLAANPFHNEKIT